MSTLSVADIALGDSVREELGDVEALAQSIARVGLLHPLVVAPDGVLIAGRRRLEAVKRLGWTEVPVTTVDLDEPFIAQRDENACRKEFTVTEKVTIARAIEAKEAAKAKERQRNHAGTAPGRKKNTPESFSEVNGESKVKTAEAVGMSRPTYEKVAKLVDAAHEDPDTYGDLVEQLDSKDISVARADREREQRRVAQLPPDPEAERKQRIARTSADVAGAISNTWARVFALDLDALAPYLNDGARTVLQDAAFQMRTTADRIDALFGRRLKSVKGGAR